MSVAMALMYALGRPFGGAGVELVWRAASANSADCRPTLRKRDEAAIGGTASATGNSAPFIGASSGRADN
jgi:hypothetical protein